jgi:hypothetical protein
VGIGKGRNGGFHLLSLPQWRIIRCLAKDSQIYETYFLGSEIESKYIDKEDNCHS